MSEGDFPAIDGNSLGTMCGVAVAPATIPLLLGSVKWLANEDLYHGDIEDIYETTQAFEKFARRLMAVTSEGGCVELVAIPSGTISPYIGTTAPDGWLMCDGSLYSQSGYPALVAKLPALLKNDVNGTFVTPDMRGKMPLGADTEYFQLASEGGEKEHALTIAELPSHTHLQNSHTHPSHNHDYQVRLNATGFGSGAIALSNGVASGPHGTTGTTTPAATAENQNTGSNLAHNNMPPYFVVNYIIKT